MVDFAKLMDPEWQAQRRVEREEEERVAQEQEGRVRAAIQLLYHGDGVYDKLTEKEQGLVRSCRAAYVTTPAQEKWLLDIAARHAPKEPIEQPKANVESDEAGDQPKP